MTYQDDFTLPAEIVEQIAKHGLGYSTFPHLYPWNLKKLIGLT